MEYAVHLEIGLFIIFMALSAFFSSSETSLFSLSALDLEQMRRDGNKRVGLINRLLSEPRRLIVTILIGNELVNVCASVISASIVIRVMGADSKWMNMFVMVPLLLLIGEITPKTLAIRHNAAFASTQSVFIEAFAKLITPIRWIVRIISDAVLTLLVGRRPSASNIVTEDMLRSLAKEAVGEGTLDRREAGFIDKIFNFDDLTVEAIMTPRAGMFTLDGRLPLVEMVNELHRTKHTKVPVFDDDGETVKGILFARDLLGVNLDDSSSPAKPAVMLRPAYMVPGNKTAADLFQVFQERKLSVALVIDEYGGVIGLVTLEDTLECIFGEIHSGSEAQRERAQSVERLAEGDFQVDATITLIRFNELTGANLDDKDVDTLGGLLLNAIGELPAEGYKTSIDGAEVTVLAVEHHRISKVRVRLSGALKNRAETAPARSSEADLTTSGEGECGGEVA